MTGWSIWHGQRLLGGGQTVMWDFAQDLWDAIHDGIGPLAPGDETHLRAGITAEDNAAGESGKCFDLIVGEIFALYPHKAKDLYWDEFRTVQLIGAMKFMATLHGIEYHGQPAKIKERALAGGAGDLFTKPVHENRHTNDSVMHGFYYVAVECNGVELRSPGRGQ